MQNDCTNQETVGSAAFGRLNNVQGDTVRRRFKLTGSYFGVLPTLSLNGRLRWPAVTAVKITDPA